MQLRAMYDAILCLRAHRHSLACAAPCCPPHPTPSQTPLRACLLSIACVLSTARHAAFQLRIPQIALHPKDVRMTTRFKADNILEGVSGAIHETGATFSPLRCTRAHKEPLICAAMACGCVCVACASMCCHALCFAPARKLNA